MDAVFEWRDLVQCVVGGTGAVGWVVFSWGIGGFELYDLVQVGVGLTRWGYVVKYIVNPWC